MIGVDHDGLGLHSLRFRRFQARRDDSVLTGNDEPGWFGSPGRIGDGGAKSGGACRSLRDEEI